MHDKPDYLSMEIPNSPDVLQRLGEMFIALASDRAALPRRTRGALKPDVPETGPAASVAVDINKTSEIVTLVGGVPVPPRPGSNPPPPPGDKPAPPQNPPPPPDPAAVFGATDPPPPPPPETPATVAELATGYGAAPPPPPPPPDPVETDSVGLPWDTRIHAGTKVKLKAGTWKRKRGITPELIATVETELRATMAAPPAATPPDPAATPGAPVGPKTLADLMPLITARPDISQTTITNVLISRGIPDLSALAIREDLVPEIHAELFGVGDVAP